jgi:ankyrin repeat protein
VGCGASADLLEALIRTGHGHFIVKCNSNRKHTIKETDILFNSTSIYDMESGREVAKCTKSSRLEPSSSADPKILSKQQFQELGHGRIGDITANLDNRLTREKNVPSVDCDVIIPWVLRNMLGSIGDQNTEYEACRNDVRRLKSTLLEYDNSGLGILLVPELEYFLDSLEIRVTKEVLREMCRRYPGDMMDIRDKFIWIESEQQSKGGRRAVMMDAEERSGDRKSGEKMYTGSDDSYGRADSKGNNSIARTSSSPSYHSDYKSSINATESSQEHKRVSESKQSTRGSLSCKYSSMVFDKIDENLGLNILQLLNDISSGRGLKYVASTYNDNSSTENTVTSQVKYLRDSLYSTGGDRCCPKGDEYHSASCCVTIAAIMKGRRDVVNICDSLGRTPLLIASALGNKKAVACLLAMDGDISIVSHDGQSAFSVAKSSDSQALPQKTLLSWMNRRGNILKHESHMVNSKIMTSEQGTSGDQNASHSADKLLQKGKYDDIDDAGSGGRVMNVEERAVAMAGVCSSLQNLKGAKWSYSRPPLMWAVHSGLLSAVEDLLCGTPAHDPNTCDTMGRSSLHECVALIRSGRTDLAEAAVSIALALMESGARVNHASISGRTPLHDLFCANHDEKVSSHRVSAEETTNPLGDFCVVNRSKRMILKSLLKHGADPILLDRQGLGAIHYCAREDSANCLLEILMSTADEWPLTRLQQSPLHIACKAGAINTAKLLCKWDADHIPSEYRKLSILLQADGQGKLPVQLLPHNTSSRCLETLWGAARAGDLSRCSFLYTLIFLK